MRSRLLTAFGLGVLLIVAILYTSPTVTAAILGLIVLIGAWEWSAFLSVAAPWRLLYVLVLGALGVAGFRYTRDADFALMRLLWLTELAVAWWLVALVWIIWAPTHVGRAAAGLAGVLALVPTWIALVRIDAHWVHGAQWTLFILALAFAADTGAFFVGRQFGRAHLAPRVSPNKTWEGVIGGMLLALLLAWHRYPLVRAACGRLRAAVPGGLGLFCDRRLDRKSAQAPCASEGQRAAIPGARRRARSNRQRHGSDPRDGARVDLARGRPMRRAVKGRLVRRQA